MKRMVSILMLIGLFGIALPAMAARHKAVFAVENMTCALCPVTVRKAMERVDGVLDVAVDFDAKTATVLYDDARTTPEAVGQASTNVGYPVTQRAD